LAAFVNSLVASGYSGTVWAGYRGPLPPWINRLKQLSTQAGEYAVNEQVRLTFVPLVSGIHFTHYKPEFMLNLLANQARDCEYIWYFDPDICLCSSWSFFASWQRRGIALCQEITNNVIPAGSPLRHMWMDAAAEIGLSDPLPLNYYFNGGAVGLAARHADFLRTWKCLIELAGRKGADLKGFSTGNREAPFYFMDQDALNVAAMYSRFPLSTVGPDGMGFIPGAVNMYHCVGPKPWRGSMLMRALGGVPPSNATKFFFSQESSPIAAYSSFQLRGKRIGCAIAALIGRFYRRR